MKGRRKEAALVASGIILGASIAAPAAGAALIAQQSSQKITVDGKPVQIEAYSISGSNYCKLRDVGRAVGFAVEYVDAYDVYHNHIYQYTRYCFMKI